MTGISSPRVLTCAYNRRRNRVHPHIVDETDGITMNVQASKSKLVVTSLKPPRKDAPTHRILSSSSSSMASSENIQEWSSLFNEEKRSDDSKRSSDEPREELYREDRPSIFRDMAELDDHEDMLVLKRANPVYDSDDEDSLAAPAKRQRTTSGDTVLQWSECLSDDEGFYFRLQL
jgi:hypothetical protein